jgi:glycosyltransferase involved in cell wall biosynthesis
MANTPDPRDFYRVSRLVLMPSLWDESFGRVAAEALVNGLPVLASRRGALPEVLAQAGFLFDVPGRYSPPVAPRPQPRGSGAVGRNDPPPLGRPRGV